MTRSTKPYIEQIVDGRIRKALLSPADTHLQYVEYASYAAHEFVKRDLIELRVAVKLLLSRVPFLSDLPADINAQVERWVRYGKPLLKRAMTVAASPGGGHG